MAGSPQNPAGALVEPELDEAAAGIGEVNEIIEWLSPTHDLAWLVGDICSLLIGTDDPIEWVKKQIGGDTEALAKVGIAIGHIGQCEEFVAQNLSAAETAMFAHWHGNAADAAKGYFDQLRSAVNKNGSELVVASQRYSSTTVAISALVTAIVTALETLGDLVIAAAVAAWVAGATWETGVGPVLAGAGFVVVCGEIVARWLEIADKVGKIVGVLSTLVTFITGLDGNIGQITLTPLPASAYDDPQA